MAPCHERARDRAAPANGELSRQCSFSRPEAEAPGRLNEHWRADSRTSGCLLQRLQRRFKALMGGLQLRRRLLGLLQIVPQQVSHLRKLHG